MALALLGALLMPQSAWARPRPALPPAPELSLFRCRFDDPASWAGDTNTALPSRNVEFIESWSGYALNMTGQVCRRFLVPLRDPNGHLRLLADAGTIRCWYAPAWTSASLGGQGPQSEACLLGFETSAGRRPGGLALLLNPQGTSLRLALQAGLESATLLEAPVAWTAGEWHQVALAYDHSTTFLVVDGELVAQGAGSLAWAGLGYSLDEAFSLGSNLRGENLAQGAFDELTTFGHACRLEEIAWSFHYSSAQARLGPISEEEEQQMLARRAAAVPAARTGGLRTMTLLAEPACPGGCDTLNLRMLRLSDGNLKLCVCGAQSNSRYDVFYTPNLNAPIAWTWWARGAAGQTEFLVASPTAAMGFFQLGTMQDTDGDGLTDAYENLVSHTSPSVLSRVDTDGDGLLDMVEIQIGTNPNAADTDGDGLPDGYEVARGLNPNFNDASQDLDQDGVSNAAECQNGTNPTDTREPLGPCSRRTDWVISEIMYQPNGGDDFEFLEFYNASLISQDLAGFGVVVLPAAGGAPVASFTFPAGSIVPSGGFLLLAKSPASFASGLATVLGPYTGSLPDSAAVIRLTNRWGAILLEAAYSSQAPWPAAAAGGGHSLVLGRPSFGEGNVAAWTASDQVGGSPGRPDFMTFEPARAVVINEYRANADSDNDRFIELYNHSNGSVGLSGYTLTDGPAGHSYTFNATTLAARGFLCVTKTQLGASFNLTGAGGVLWLRNPAGTRLVDAIAYGPQEKGQVTGRETDGALTFHELLTATPGAPNSGLRLRDIVINEIMPNPISGDADDEYVELYNRSATQAYDVSGWSLVGQDGSVPFLIPSGTTLPVGGYLVLAHDATKLITKYASDLTTANCKGPAPWKLSNQGQRLALRDAAGVLISEVIYGDGGQWGRWSAGGGSSLELIDPRSDARLPSNWADSDERSKSTWGTVATTAPMSYGDGNAINALEIILLGEGECLVDNVEVRQGGGANLVANSTFEAGISGWTVEGTHDLSDWEPPSSSGGLGGFNSNGSLHLRATKRGDYLANRVWVGWTPSIPNNYSGNITLSAQVRWLRGHPEVVLRLRGNGIEATGERNIAPTSTTKLGSPGKKNSVTPTSPNSAPAIFQVAHQPILPAANQAVVVTGKFADPDGLSTRQLKYRLDPSSTWTTLAMTDDGLGGDAVAGDGVFSATIPGQAAGAMVAFRVEATDTLNASSRFPKARVMYPGDTEQRECLIRFGEVRPAGSIGTYRVWMTQATLTKWTNLQDNPAGRYPYHNGDLDVTLVLGGDRVIYNAGARFSGSANSSDLFISPTALTSHWPFSSICGYAVDVPSDDPCLGSTDLLLPHPNRIEFDATLQKEPLMEWLGLQLGIPVNHRRYVHLYVNGVERGRSHASAGAAAESDIMEDVYNPNSDFLKSWYPTDNNGDFFKLEWWWYNSALPVGPGAVQCTLERFPGSGAINLARYRWTWMKRAVNGSANDYSRLFALVEMANTGANSPDYTAQMDSVVDVDQWTRVFAFQRVLGNRDAYGTPSGNGHNMYAYKPESGKWQMIPCDLEAGILNSSSDLLLAESIQDPLLPRFIGNPRFQRALWRSLQEAAAGTLLTTAAQSLVGAYHAALQANQVNLPAETPIISWLADRRTYIQTQLGTLAASFAVTTAGGSTADNPVLIQGTAPVTVTDLRVNGVSYPVTWTSVTAWRLRVPLSVAGDNVLTIGAFDATGSPVGNAQAITFNYTGTYLPGTEPFINEVMAKNDTTVEDPADGDHDDWIEICNPSATVLDFSGYRLKRVRATTTVWIAPAGTTIPPGGFLLIWADDEGGQNGRYGPGSEPHASFKLADNDVLWLYTPGDVAMHSVSIGNATTDRSLGRYPDRPDSPFQTMTTPTPRRPNVAP